MKTIMTLFLLVMLAGCSDNNDANKGDHVWKEQTDTIKRAEQVEGKVMESVQLQKKAIEEETQ